MDQRFIAVMLFPVLSLCACVASDEAGRDGGPSPEPSGAEPILRGPCAEGTRVGGFALSIGSDAAYFTGEVKNAVLPGAVPEALETAGACRLVRKVNPVCLPPCLAGQACAEDGQCIPFPQNQDVGNLTIEGLGTTRTVSPTEPGQSYFASELPWPPAQPDAAIALM